MKKAIYPLLVLALLACTKKEEKKAQPTDVVGLCSPIKLQHGQTHLYLADYFLQPERLDSFHMPLTGHVIIADNP